MERRVRLEPASHVPSDAHVCDYDELDPAAMDGLPDLAAGGTATDTDLVAGLADCDLVRFTGYYRVEVQ